MTICIDYWPYCRLPSVHWFTCMSKNAEAHVNSSSCRIFSYDFNYLWLQDFFLCTRITEVVESSKSIIHLPFTFGNSKQQKRGKKERKRKRKRKKERNPTLILHGHHNYHIKTVKFRIPRMRWYFDDYMVFHGKPRKNYYAHLMLTYSVPDRAR